LEFILLLQSNAGAMRFLQNSFGVSAEANRKSDNGKIKTAHLRVRQFWHEKGKWFSALSGKYAVFKHLTI
jgi:hypothetical protein